MILRGLQRRFVASLFTINYHDIRFMYYMHVNVLKAYHLPPMAWNALVKVLYESFGRWEKLTTTCYKFIIEPSAIDVVSLAKAASGGRITSVVAEGKA